jgi:imidazolonepropionase-like amidohydrolase
MLKRTGYDADLLVVVGDPVADIGALGRPEPDVLARQAARH